MLKKKNNPDYGIRKIRTFEDLRREKKRMQSEADRMEDRIHFNYSNLKEALSPAHLLKSIIEDINRTLSVISGAYAVGKKIFKKKKKKEPFADQTA